MARSDRATLRPGVVLDAVPLAGGRAYGRLSLQPTPHALAIRAVESATLQQGMLRGAAGAVLVSAAPLAHALRHEALGEVPAVALARARLRRTRRGPVLEVVSGPNRLRLAGGEAIVADGEEGWLWLPGGTAPPARARARRVAELLARLARDPRRSRWQALLRELERAPTGVLYFGIEALVLGDVGLPPRVLRYVAERLGPRPESGALTRALARRVRGRARAVLVAADLASPGREPQALESALRAVALAMEELRRLAAWTGRAEPELQALQRSRGRLLRRRRAVLQDLERRLRAAAALDETSLRHRRARLEELLERSSAVRARLPVRALARRLERALARRARALVVPFPSRGAPARLVGGKAELLGRVASALPRDIAVPRGFVVTTVAYRRHVRPLLRELAAAVARADPAVASRRARAILLGRPLETALRRHLCRAAETLGDGPLAVRSSATWEGKKAARLNGLLESYIGARGTEALLRRVRDVWASGWSPGALDRYRRLGVRPGTVGLAVLVERAVATRAAGVMRVPESASHPERIVVNAWWGLGEAIAQGETRGDVYRLERRTGRTLEYVPGDGSFWITLGAAGPQEQPLPGRLRGRPCLSPRVRARLTHLARTLAREGWTPCEVEFGVDTHGKLFVFQVQPLA